MTDPAASMVRAHYEALGDLYRAAWGDSLHFAFFTGDEARADAVAATERLLVDEAGIAPGMSVLDVGCGAGGPALAIATYSGAHVTGIDLVSAQIRSARKMAAERGLANRTTFVEADATALPFDDATFDHVYAIESAYHATDKPRFYAECVRVLRPGGCFLGTDWLEADGIADADRARYLDPVRDHFGFPYLLSPEGVRAHLEASGVVCEVVEDLAARGNVDRNWEPLDHETWPKLARAAREAGPGALRTFAEGAKALAAASQAGAFLLGHFRARKPVAVSGPDP